MALISIAGAPPVVSNLMNSEANPSQTSKFTFGEVILSLATGSINKVYVSNEELAIPEQY